MAVLSKEEARRERAKKHSTYSHKCSLCGRITFGNGGRSSHYRAHQREISGFLGYGKYEKLWWLVNELDKLVGNPTVEY